ncbi:MAG: 1-acyl-sn-glycerol-3-phosphate acyltransferase [Bradymonadales bacterium]|nr:1-acyl-sn-glycerol-3-phosphate acyltransferase [Bradymonadales bacterium]
MARTLLFHAFFLPWTVTLLIVGLVIGLVPGTAPVMLWIAKRLWAPVMLKLGGARVVPEGDLDELDPSVPYIFVSNHQGYFDVASLFTVLPHRLRFVAKIELALIPLFGWYMIRVGCPIVHRSKPDQAYRAMDRAVDKIKKGVPIFVFAEGTRSHDGNIAPFKRGAFLLAIKSGVPIVPIAIRGSYQVMNRHSLRVTPGVIRLSVGKPIPTDHLTLDDRLALTDQVREAILKRYESLGG